MKSFIGYSATVYLLVVGAGCGTVGLNTISPIHLFDVYHRSAAHGVAPEPLDAGAHPEAPHPIEVLLLPAPPAPRKAAPYVERTDSSAQERCEELRRSIGEAYRDFRFEDVQDETEELVASSSATAKQKVYAYVLAGAAAYIQGNGAKAIEYFRNAYRLDPYVRLDEAYFTDAILRLFKESRPGN